MTERNQKKQIVGKVTKKSGDKTVAVTVESLKRHPMYQKVYRVTQKFLAHDNNNMAQVGDKVVISECRPLSKRKSWRVHKILNEQGETK